MLSYTPAALFLSRVGPAGLPVTSAAAATDRHFFPFAALSMPVRAMSSGGGGEGKSGDGGGVRDFSHFVKRTLETAATASTEGASAFFKPQGVSPLTSLRPPTPPSASDARPFGYLNRGNRPRRYTNANAGAATAAPAGDSRSGPKEGGDGGGPRQNGSAAASLMHLDKLMRTHHHQPGTSASTDAAAADGATTTTGASPSYPASMPSPACPPNHQRHQQPGNATVEKAQAAIAAAERVTQEQEATSPSPSASRATRLSSSSPSPSPKGSSTGHHHQQLYREHCTIGWSPREFYDVVADVAHYPNFLPWCLEAQVHSSRPVQVRASEVKQKSPHYYETVVLPMMREQSAMKGREEEVVEVVEVGEVEGEGEEFMVDAVEMRATLWVGFSFFKEQYTSCVTLLPGSHITAALADESGDGTDLVSDGDSSSSSAHRDEGLLASLFRKAADSTGVSAVKKSILKSLICEWDFVPVDGNKNAVEVSFAVSFEFKNPMHAKMIMNNIVALMTRSFERQCERLYGPPSAQKQVLPLPIA